MPQSNISAESSITIKASPQEVYRYVANLKHHYLWNPSLRSVSPEAELKPGMSFQTESVILKDIKISTHNVVTKLVPNRLVSIHNEMGLVKYDIDFMLTKEGKYTIATSKVSMLTSSQAFGLTLPVLKRLANRELQSDLESLKFAVETDLASNM